MYQPTKAEIKIYGGGKTWMGHEFTDMRDIHGFNIVGSWIGVQHILKDPTDHFTQEVFDDHDTLKDVWRICLADTLKADCMILGARPVDENDHSGSLVELGQILAQGKPVYVLGTCQSFEPYKNSDRAFMFHDLVQHWREYGTEKPLIDGFHAAVKHYQEHFSSQWCENNRDELFKKARHA